MDKKAEELKVLRLANHYASYIRQNDQIFYNTSIFTLRDLNDFQLMEFPVNWPEERCIEVALKIERPILAAIEKAEREIHGIPDKVLIKPPLGSGASEQWIEQKYLTEMVSRGWYQG